MVENMQLPFACHQLGCYQTAKLKIILNPPNRGARIPRSESTVLVGLRYFELLSI
jgi:hypothetical protein